MARIAVVGGGLAGCAAAVRLGAAGHDVTIYEANAHLGGKMNVWESNGYRFDMGPTIITKPDVLDRLFTDVGRRREDYLDLRPLDPQWRAFFSDGSRIDLYSSLQQMTAELERFAPGELKGYLEFLTYAQRMYSISDEWFFWKPYGGLPDLMRANPMSPKSLGLAAAIDPFKSMHSAVRRHFRDARLAQLFEHFVQYVGSSPFVAPAILCLIAWVQIGLGCWYPMGGTGRIAAALARLCEEFGVTIRCGEAVDGIEVEGGRAVGVRAGGRAPEPFDAVVANSDVVRTLETLLSGPEAGEMLRKGGPQLQPACSGVVVYLGCNRIWPDLAHHDFLFSADSDAEFNDLYTRGVPHADPTCYLAIPSITDPGCAPPGKSAVYVLVHTPPVGPEWRWEERAADYRDTILNKLEATVMPGLRESIEVSRMITPVDLERMYRVNRGAIYGVVTQRGLGSAFKTGNRSRSIRGLYWAGGSVNPGPGVPMVLMSGQIAANCVLEDIGPGTPGRQ